MKIRVMRDWCSTPLWGQVGNFTSLNKEDLPIILTPQIHYILKEYENKWIKLADGNFEDMTETMGLDMTAKYAATKIQEVNPDHDVIYFSELNNTYLKPPVIYTERN